MDSSKFLEKYHFELKIPPEIIENTWRNKNLGLPFPASLKKSELVIRVFDKIRQGGKLVVEFEIPKAIKMGLESGQYIRKGGVIVTSDGHHVVHWLKEGNVLRVGKAVSVLCILVDVLSELLLNEKLKQIQIQLDRIERYSRAEHHSSFLHAHTSLKAALKATDPDYRIHLFRESRSYFQKASVKSFVILKEMGKDLKKELRNFDKSWFDNRGNLTRFYGVLEEIADVANRISHCYTAEARICERLGEIPSAEDLHSHALNFQAASYEFVDFFVNGRGTSYWDYADLEFVQSGIMGSEYQYQGQYSGKIHERVKDVTQTAKDAALTTFAPVYIAAKFVQGFVEGLRGEPSRESQGQAQEIPSWIHEVRDPISKKLEAMEGHLATQFFEMTSTKQGSKKGLVWAGGMPFYTDQP